MIRAPLGVVAVGTVSLVEVNVVVREVALVTTGGVVTDAVEACETRSAGSAVFTACCTAASTTRCRSLGVGWWNACGYPGNDCVQAGFPYM